MTPLQQAAQAVIDRWDAPLNKVHMGMEALRKALADEQAQAVEPVAWLVYVAEVQNQYVVDDIDDPQLVDDCTNHNAEVTPLYTHPAPPAGERAKVGDSRFESWYSELHQAGKGSKQIVREAYEAGLNEAQQVAVPDGWVLVPTEALLHIKNRVNTLATLSLKAERYSVGREIKQDIADMLAAAQGSKPVAQQVAVPAGYVLVPIEPTSEMLGAARRYDYRNPTDPTWGGIYSVMLAAAQGVKQDHTEGIAA